MLQRVRPVSHCFLTSLFATIAIVGCDDQHTSSPATPPVAPPRADTTKKPSAAARGIFLTDAVIRGDVEAIRQNIATGTDLNQRIPGSGSTPLMLAATLELKEPVRLLIETGARLDEKNNEFKCYGIPLQGVVNQARHDRVVGSFGPSKYPPAFGIDLHVDDSEGVAQEGKKYGFTVVIVSPEDVNWTERVLEAVTLYMDQ